MTDIHIGAGKPGSDDTHDQGAADAVDIDNDTKNPTRINKLLKILQGPPPKESPDETLIKCAQLDYPYTPTFRPWEIDIQESDWEDLISGGLTWDHLETFIKNVRCNHVIVGPLVLRTHSTYDHPIDDGILFDGVYIHRRRACTATEAKTAFDGFMKLLLASRGDTVMCNLLSDSIFFDRALHCGVKYSGITFCCLYNTEDQILQKCLQQPHMIDLGFSSSTLRDGGTALCEWLTDRKDPIRRLCLSYLNIDMSMLSLAFHPA